MLFIALALHNNFATPVIIRGLLIKQKHWQGFVQRLAIGMSRMCDPYLISRRNLLVLWFDKKGFPNGELGDLLKLCLALKIEGLDSVVKPLKRI